jgi:hypothetical protein
VKERINVEKAFETVARNALACEKDIDNASSFPEPIEVLEPNISTQPSGCPC